MIRKKALYIGFLSKGSTSLMRYEALQENLKEFEIQTIDLTVFFEQHNKLINSLGWRYKIGPLIKNINKTISEQSQSKHYDFVWLDKATLIKPETIKQLRRLTANLIHYTPDPAFTYHRSRLFFDSIPLFDICITTKSFEVRDYYERKAKKVILSTQGYLSSIHFSSHCAQEKQGVVFIGHYEKERAELIQALIDHNIPVKLAGIKWVKFKDKNKHNPFLNYLGEAVYGQEYQIAISSARIGLGLLSKWIPELHTTRTFEIPACGTVLLTEKNNETETFFSEEEVIFCDVNDISEMMKTVKHWYNSPNLQEKSIAMTKKMKNHTFDYFQIVKQLIETCNIK